MTITPSTPGINTSLGDEGLGQQPWWVEQWMELINSYRFKKRLERAWTDAREGNVTSIRFCLLYTSPSPRDATLSRMPSSA